VSYRNNDFVSILEAKSAFYEYCDTVGDITKQSTTPEIRQLENAFVNISTASFKILHPLFMKSYRLPRAKFRTQPLKCVGLDIETNYVTGEPMLLGFWHPTSRTNYYHIFNPQLSQLFQYVRDMVENTDVSNMMVWGNLDIQCLIRMFEPTEQERNRISRGIGADVVKGKFTTKPPCTRRIGKTEFYIGHYIAGRSLKLGYIENGHNRTVWVFNGSQFWPGRIAQTAKGLGLDWHDFADNTHKVDWSKFRRDLRYRNSVLESNKQDARIVHELTQRLQDQFHAVFDCYPSLLVSTGSITDAAVSKMLSGKSGDSEYQSNSWRWLRSNVWAKISNPEMAEIETLMSEAFSGGYVDQFAMGYFPNMFNADIAAAYPHKIQSLPDLRVSELFSNKGQLESDLEKVHELDYDVETAIIRGKVTIPKTLKYHPITVKTYSRQNYRPTGMFYATYTLEERNFCQEYGATFSDEEYVIVALHERILAPIARVSARLSVLRDEILASIDCPVTDYCDECRVKNTQQYLVKIINNSIYGKTIMTTETVEDVDGEPQITGYVAGDRFNPLYATIITSRTRVQIARACMAIFKSGGQPVMTMTDSICWTGAPEMLPLDGIREAKTSGYFEPVQSLQEFYILKTGQYEYFNPEIAKWTYKIRGLSVDFQTLTGKSSFFRDTIKRYCERLPVRTDPRNIKIPIDTRRLLTIGQRNMDFLGAITEGKTLLQPFALSAKQSERYLVHWRDCLDSHIVFATPHITGRDNETTQYPLRWLHDVYVNGANERHDLTLANVRAISRKTSKTLDEQKKLYVWYAWNYTGRAIPKGRYFRLSWEELENHFEVPRNTILSKIKAS
jgi:hypothetical protein